MDDWLPKYKTKLKEIERLFQENEDLLRANGINGPVSHPPVTDKERIWIPRGYIRTADYFRKNYALPQLVSDLSTRNNIAYALQLSDMLNFISNRFHLGKLSLGNSFYRIATAHIFSIIESILCGMINTIHNDCTNNHEICSKAAKCTLYFKRAGKYKFSELLNKLSADKMIDLSAEDIDALSKHKGIRDRLHMWDAGDSDFHDSKFSVSEYNEAIQLLTKIRGLAVSSFPSFHARHVFSCPKKTLDC